MEAKMENKKPMVFYHMADFLKEKMSKIPTNLSTNDETAFVKKRKPLTTLMLHEKKVNSYEKSE